MSPSKNSLAYKTYNLVASQNPRADIRLLPNTHGEVEIAAHMLPATAPAAQRRADAGGVFAGRDACPVEIAANLDTALKCDPDLARLSVGLRQAAQLRLWLPIVENARETGYNHLTRDALRALLVRYRIRFSERNLSRWLRAGHGLYWNLCGDTIWLIGYERLSKALVNLALTTKTKRGKPLHNLVATNNPGYYRPVYINVASERLEQFEAACYSGWLTAKCDPTISYYTLGLLFNRTAKTLIRWNKIAKVTILHNFVHYTENTSNQVPLDTTEKQHRGDVLPYTVGKHKRWSATFSNTYQPQITKQHAYRGKSRRVSIAMHKLLSSVLSVGTIAQVSHRDGGLNRIGRKLFNDGKKAFKKATAVKPVYVLLGIDNRRCAHHVCIAGGRVDVRFKQCAEASLQLEVQ